MQVMSGKIKMIMLKINKMLLPVNFIFLPYYEFKTSKTPLKLYLIHFHLKSYMRNIILNLNLKIIIL